MNIHDYYHRVLMPANRAISMMQLAGVPLHVGRIRRTRKKWARRIQELEAYVVGEAQSRGLRIKFSDKHQLGRSDLTRLLYGKKGLSLPIVSRTEKTDQPSTDASTLRFYADLANPREDDDPIVTALLEIRSLSGCTSKYLDKFETFGMPSQWRDVVCAHPTVNWGKVRTARVSFQEPPMHQIPEKAHKEAARGVKSCIVPRVKPCEDPDDWDPRKHGSCFRWDIAGAEMVIRGGMLTKLFCETKGKLYKYIKRGDDLHARTAAFLMDKPVGTYKKGDYERDTLGKICNFALLYGAQAFTLQLTIWNRARMWVEKEKVEQYWTKFFQAWPELAELYEYDKDFLGRHHYVEDGYGRRRWIPYPSSARYVGMRNGKAQWVYPDRARKALQHAFHVSANSPTQSTSASDNMFMIALTVLGEYVELQTPGVWDTKGKVLFPEAKQWGLHEGPGPGGKPLRAWYFNTVHDSAWGDCAPGHLEATAKVIARRCTAVPFDQRLSVDLPYRVDLSVGPDMANLYDYNVVAKRFGFETLPVR